MASAWRDPWAFRGAATVLILLAALAGIVVAVRMTRRPGPIVHVVNLIAAGVFLAAGLVHALPDADEVLSQRYSFPWAFVTAGGGFLAMWAVECSTSVWIARRYPQALGFLGQVNGTDRADHGPSEDAAEMPADDGVVRALMFRRTSVSVAAIMFLALSFHSFIAGLALGLADDPKQKWKLLVAILLHKGVAA